MAHIPVSFSPITDKNLKKYIYSLPASGMMLSEKEQYMDGSEKCAYLSNMDITDGCAETRTGQEQAGLIPSGSIHSVTREAFCGRLVMHIGSCLYSYVPKDNEPMLISSSLPDKKSLFCLFMSKLYIYCDGHVFSLDDSFVFTEEQPDATLLYDEVSPASGYLAKPIKDAPYNLVCPRIRVNFSFSTFASFYFPVDADISRKVVFYIDDEVVPEGEYTLYETRIVYSLGDSTGRTASVEYYVKNPEDIGYQALLYDCTLCESFGGSAGGGTRVFFTGNENHKGRYFKSALQNPLCVLSDEKEYIGDGCENITALKKMYGDLIVFTDRSVFKMQYNLTQDGSFFSVRQISHGIGCDCPDTVQLIDNRVVFANSEKGVFIVSSTDEAGEQNIKPISKNIFKGNGGGISDMARDAVKSAFSLDFDRKYMLFAGNKAYIWDYDATSFIDSGNYALSQGRLKWYMYENVSGDFFFVLEDCVFSIDRQAKKMFRFSKDAVQDFEAVFDTGLLSFKEPFGKKTLCDLELLISRDGVGEMELEVFCDGEKICQRLIDILGKNKTKIRIKLPCSHGYGYSFRLRSNAHFRLFGAAFTYKTMT